MPAYDDGQVKLLAGDCREVPAPSEAYALVTDPPCTIRSAKHVDELLASFGWSPISYVVLTNPEPGYVRDGQVIHREALRSAGPAPTFQRPLAIMLQLMPEADLLIFDPFSGTGTTLVAARLAGRRALGIERREPLVELAVRRLTIASQD